jgi:prepilin-type N-terminal cleavage/methylation domain-containing protein
VLTSLEDFLDVADNVYGMRRAFTLVELLIAIVIVAVLASIAIPKFADRTLKNKEAALRASLRIIREAGDRCEADTALTVDVTHLTQVTPPANGWERGPMNTNWTAKPINPSRWRGPYLNAVPVNPILGTNKYVTGGGDATTAWTHYSRQTFNKHYYYYPSTTLSSIGTPYRTW